MGVIVGVRLTWLNCNSIAFLFVSFAANICGKYAWVIMLTISCRKQGDSVVITGTLNYDKLCVIMNAKHVPEYKIVLDSCVWFWFLGSVFESFLDSGKYFWILAPVLSLRATVLLLRSFFCIFAARISAFFRRRALLHGLTACIPDIGARCFITRSMERETQA